MEELRMGLDRLELIFVPNEDYCGRKPKEIL